MFAAICIAVIVYLVAKSGKIQHFLKVHPRIPKILVLMNPQRQRHFNLRFNVFCAHL